MYPFWILFACAQTSVEKAFTNRKTRTVAAMCRIKPTITAVQENKKKVKPAKWSERLGLQLAERERETHSTLVQTRLLVDNSMKRTSSSSSFKCRWKWRLKSVSGCCENAGPMQFEGRLPIANCSKLYKCVRQNVRVSLSMSGWQLLMSPVEHYSRLSFGNSISSASSRANIKLNFFNRKFNYAHFHF